MAPNHYFYLQFYLYFPLYLNCHFHLQFYLFDIPPYFQVRCSIYILPDYKKKGRRAPNHHFHLQFYLYFIRPTKIVISQMYCTRRRNTDSQNFMQVCICNPYEEIDFTNQRNTDSQHFQHLCYPPEEIVPIFVIPYFLTLVGCKDKFIFARLSYFY